MPTERPRLTVTLTPKTAAALAAGAKAMRRSQASIVLELVNGIAPALEKLAIARQAFERASPAQAAELLARVPHLHGVLDAIGVSAEGSFDAALSSLDLFAGSPQPAPAGRSHAGAGAGGVASKSGSRKVAKASSGGAPPLSNRGVGNGGQGGQPPSKVTRIRGRSRD